MAIGLRRDVPGYVVLSCFSVRGFVVGKDSKLLLWKICGSVVTIG